MRLYLRGKVWWIAWYANGVELRQSTKTKSRKVANVVLNRWQRDAADPSYSTSDKATVGSAAERFLDEVGHEGRAEGTVNMYELKVRHVVKHLGGLKLSELSHDHVLAFIKTREAEGSAHHTVHRELTALRRILKSAARAREFNRDPKSVIPKYAARYVPRTRFLTREELDLVMAHMAPARAAVVAYAVATAADLGSLQRAQRGDAGPEMVVVRGTKTKNRHRTIPRVRLFADLLAFALEHADGDPPLLFQPWGNMRRDIAAACKRAGIPTFTSNDLRRTSATWLVKRGVPLNVAAKFMGHASTAMLQKVYGQLDTSDVGRLIEERTEQNVRALYGAPSRVSDKTDTKHAKSPSNRGDKGDE
jgi:integrase